MASDASRSAARLVICLKGPTASGKTELAVALAREFPLDVISVDSALVYRRMDIGTAKPSAEMLRQTPHALIDLCEPWQTYSAGLFCRDAAASIHASWEKGRVPLLAGGTLLYFDALSRGLAAMPDRDMSIRAQIDAEADRHGWRWLHEQLASVDPDAAARISAADTQRIQRALEVYRITGVPISELQQKRKPRLDAAFVEIALVPSDRQALADRIEARFDRMLEDGFVDEVRSLLAEPEIRPDLPSMRAVGYRQLIGHLTGNTRLADAREMALSATRQLAKRQLTWLRGQADNLIADPDDREAAEAVRHYVLAALGHRANTQRTG